MQTYKIYHFYYKLDVLEILMQFLLFNFNLNDSQFLN